MRLSPVPVAAPALNRTLLRFITCGSVDDGKSTLLGRLLHETGAVFEDQVEALARDSRRFGTTGDQPDYALLVDGLAAEREQGITIDVAYRYFSTPRRAFIAADTPGHEQYTRNMATGASTADVAIILVDARKGLLPQTRRHSYIVSMLGVRRVIVAVNKMDLVGYDEATFAAIERAYRALVPALGFTEVHVLPLSAVNGDNMVGPSARTPWYAGPALLHLLETVEVTRGGDAAFRFPVQWVNRPHLDFRGFSGTLASGVVRTGDRVVILPRGHAATVAAIAAPDGARTEAVAGEAVTISLAEEVDVSRGDVMMLEAAGAHTSGRQAARTLAVRLLGLTETPLTPGRTYLAKIGTALVNARLVSLAHAVDVHDYSHAPADALPLNGIGLATLRFEAPVAATRYDACRDLGSLLLIDPFSNETAALGVVEAVTAEPPAAAEAAPVVGMDAEALRAISWRIVSAFIFALALLLATGSVLLGLAAGAAEFLARPLLRQFHDKVWRAAESRRLAREAARLSTDGGGI